jgi:hypothetical protein
MRRVLRFHQIPADDPAPRRTFWDATVFQTREWLQFLAETQRATPICAEIRDGSSLVGYFTGLLFSRLGVRVLGSPFPGWTTMYMGFNLEPDVPRWLALEALPRFAFRELGTLHVEVGDPFLTPEDGQRAGLQWEWVDSWETDLRQSEEILFQKMESVCRRNIRKAEKSGLVAEESGGEGFAGEYYAQLREVFAKQGLVPTYPQERVEALIRYLLPAGNLLLLRVRDPEGRCVATGIYPGLNRLAQFWGNASWRAYQHYRPNEFLHWHAMRAWKQRGSEVFDWGGGGGYKEKYGCRAIRSPRFHKSRFDLLWKARSLAQFGYRWLQERRGSRVKLPQREPAAE